MLEHATALVLEVGVSGFTIDELAKRSKVAKTTIYRHFPSRTELLVAALDGQIPAPDTPTPARSEATWSSSSPR